LCSLINAAASKTAYKPTGYYLPLQNRIPDGNETIIIYCHKNGAFVDVAYKATFIFCLILPFPLLLADYGLWCSIYHVNVKGN